MTDQSIRGYSGKKPQGQNLQWHLLMNLMLEFFFSELQKVNPIN